jgi:integrase
MRIEHLDGTFGGRGCTNSLRTKGASMEYMTREELVRLFKVARKHHPLHHVAMLVGLLHGLRVSETLAIRGRDICDGKLSVKRLKKSRATLHALRIDRSDKCPLGAA